MSAIVTTNLLNTAISYAFIRSYFDHPRNSHSYGDANQRWSCSHKLLVIISKAVEQQASLFQYLPSVNYSKKQKTDTHLEDRCLSFLSCCRLPIIQCKYRQNFQYDNSFQPFLTMVVLGRFSQ